MSLMEMLTEQLSEGTNLDRLSRSLGADRQTTESAVSAALPMIVGALANNAARGGADPLARALERDHDGSILDQLGGFLGAGRTDDGEGILRHALGARRDVAERQVSQLSGLSSSDARRLLALLAPVVMGAVGKMMRQRQMDAGGLTEVLVAERREVERRVPQAGGLLGQLLDSDGDGEVLDDAVSLGSSLLGAFLKRR